MQIRASNSISNKHAFLIALGIITISGLLMRLRGLWSESMTADEMYALICTRESKSLSDLLHNWVARDGHPPFSYILEFYWQRWFGIQEGTLRLPFALMGAASVWCMGRVGARWFSTGTGLATAAGLAFLQLPLMYSQLTRPYACGLLFVSLLAWCWTRWLLDERPHWIWLVGFVGAALGALYSHYFSFLVALLMGCAGLFFLPGRRWPYLLAGFIVVILFLPYLSIFIGQMQIGGIGSTSGGWLAPPKPLFFAEHIWVLFNQSQGLLYAVGILVGLSIVYTRTRLHKFHLLAILFFLLPLLIGYAYSIWRNPVLQHSVLIFSVPFLLLFLFSWMPSIHERLINWLFPIMLFGLFAGYTIFWKPYRLTNHFGRLKEIVSLLREIEQRDGADQVASAFNVDYPYYLGYYWEQNGATPKPLFTHNNGDTTGLADFRRKLAATNARYFVYGWSTAYSPPEILNLIQEKYPTLLKCERWFNSACYVFSRDSSIKKEPSETQFATHLDFARPLPNWSAVDQKVIRTDSSSGRKYIILDSTNLFSPNWKGTLDRLVQSPDHRIIVRAQLRFTDSRSTAAIVIAINRDGKQLYWNGRNSHTQYLPEFMGTWQNIYFGLYLPDDLQLSDEVAIYVFTDKVNRVELAELEVRGEKGHPGIYGVRKGYSP